MIGCSLWEPNIDVEMIGCSEWEQISITFNGLMIKYDKIDKLWDWCFDD